MFHVKLGDTMGEVPVMFAQYLGLIGFGLVFGWLCVWSFPLRAARRHVAALGQQKDALKQQLLELDRGHADDLRSLRSHAVNQQRRADEYLAVIRGIQGERDLWRDMYFSAASGGEAAQAMFTKEIQRISVLYHKETGKFPPKNQALAQIQESFAAQHGAAITEFRADGGKAGTEAKHTEENRQVELITARAADASPSSSEGLQDVED